MQFLERLARALNMDEISHDIGIDLHTESILMRAEQLSRLESEKLVDKASIGSEVLDFDVVSMSFNFSRFCQAARLSNWIIAATTPWATL